jgi:hypothetical protein
VSVVGMLRDTSLVRILREALVRRRPWRCVSADDQTLAIWDRSLFEWFPLGGPPRLSAGAIPPARPDRADRATPNSRGCRGHPLVTEYRCSDCSPDLRVALPLLAERCQPARAQERLLRSVPEVSLVVPQVSNFGDGTKSPNQGLHVLREEKNLRIIRNSEGWAPSGTHHEQVFLRKKRSYAKVAKLLLCCASGAIAPKDSHSVRNCWDTQCLNRRLCSTIRLESSISCHS